MLHNIDWNTVDVRNVDAVVDAFLVLGEDERGRMIEEFSNIKLLATPAGKVQLIDEAFFHHVNEVLAEQLAQLDDIYACAFYACLEHRKVWEGAVFYAAADSKPKRYWCKRINMPRLGRQPTECDGLALASAVSDVFMKTEARGSHCEVRQLRRGEHGDREYYFAYPQDHRMNTIQYHDGVITKRPYNPAFEIIFEHNDAAQTLSIWHYGKMDRVRDLQQAFARAVLGQEVERDSPRDDRD